MGCLIKVLGDLPPVGSYLILAPRVKLLPEVLPAAKEFMTSCASFKSLQLQLQLGRSAVMDQTGQERNDRLLSSDALCQGCAANSVCIVT